MPYKDDEYFEYLQEEHRRSKEEAHKDDDHCSVCGGEIPVPGMCEDCLIAEDSDEVERYKSNDPLEEEKELLEKLTSIENAYKQDPDDKPPKLYILEED